jgi:acyl dehydratase
MPYLEEFEPGQTIETPARTIYQHDITNFAYMSADWHPLHTDEEFARASMYGGILAHGPLVLVAAYGLMVRAGVFEEQAIGFLGLSWEMTGAVRPGDTIRVEVAVRTVRRSRSKPDRGVVEMGMTVRNQRDEVVATGLWKNLFKSRESAT